MERPTGRCKYGAGNHELLLRTSQCRGAERGSVAVRVGNIDATTSHLVHAFASYMAWLSTGATRIVD